MYTLPRGRQLNVLFRACFRANNNKKNRQQAETHVTLHPAKSARAQVCWGRQVETMATSAGPSVALTSEGSSDSWENNKSNQTRLGFARPKPETAGPVVKTLRPCCRDVRCKLYIPARKQFVFVGRLFVFAGKTLCFCWKTLSVERED